MGKKLGRFPEGVLEHVSKTIGDYRTGSDIAELLRNAGYPDKSMVTGTKWRFLYELLKEFNDKPDGQFHVARIVEVFCEPTRWIGKETVHKQVMDTLNAGLIHVNLQINDDGKIVVTQRRIIHVIKKEEISEVSTEPKFMTVSPIFRARDMKPEQNLCFVLMPFKAPFDRLYREKIKPTVEACRFKCLKADDLFSPTSIPEDIWIHICKCKVLIADVTGRNPNVFYEIGIAHTVGKPVIIITQDKADIPFDIAQFRYVLYSDDSKGWGILCSNITSALRTIVDVS